MAAMSLFMVRIVNGFQPIFVTLTGVFDRKGKNSIFYDIIFW